MQQNQKSDSGRLVTRLRPTARAALSPSPSGLQPLHLGDGRDGLIYVPHSYRTGHESPLVVMLHGAGGNATQAIPVFHDFAEEKGVILIAPNSRGSTWDVIIQNYGPDIEFIDRCLDMVFNRYLINPAHLAIAGFSDGASYALSVGMMNGDLFTHIIAFSPGFTAALDHEGEPCIFISHGLRDKVLPIDLCSRRVVPKLKAWGYDVTYREFDGGHTMPSEIIKEGENFLI